MAFSQKEDTLVLEFQAFSGGIYSDPSRYQVPVPDAATIKSAVDEFIAARVIANVPSTRTKTTIDFKQAKKISALGICRTFYKLIQDNQGISNDDKIAIGVTPLGGPRTERLCPQTSPSLAVVASTPGAITAEFRDSTDLTKKAKPIGAQFCQLWVVVDDENAPDPDNARFVGTYMTNPMAITFNPNERGKQATLFARWGGKRNNTFGQWSVPVSLTIAA